MFELLLLKRRTSGTTYSGPHYALLAGGAGYPYGLKSSQKYFFDADNIVSATSLIAERYGHTATSSITDAYFQSGRAASGILNTSEKFSYSANTVSQAALLAIPRYYAAGVGNDSVGIIGGGQNGVVRFSSTEKYTYSNQSVSPGVSLSALRDAPAAVGNYNYGLFSLGNNPTLLVTSEKYHYFTDTRTMGASLAVGRSWAGCIGNNSFGLFVAGSKSYSNGQASVKNVDIYNYASDVVSVGSSAAVARCAHVTASTPTMGLITLGSNGYVVINTTEKINFSSMSWSAGTTMSPSRESLAGASSLPSWTA
ncbi:MAG: hypothetical protein PHQ58_04375 [Rhodoferax sp.]|uniref:hypothetical protein n=1 Tax=Rhodoferax sp. TaxID=50421 RepID=UPI002616A2FB|nr:hypothetical protein [Rhodoferax sp.]MDD2879651.1 hypothetical protein [Rhodoferax sp.]